MYDRPNLPELLDAARLHLETHVIPAIRADPKLYFQTLVAINVLKIAGREIHHAPRHALAEWASLNALTGIEAILPHNLAELQAGIVTRNALLCAAIRRGEYDDGERYTQLAAHVKAVTIAQLEVANPKYLQTLAQEDQQKIEDRRRT